MYQQLEWAKQEPWYPQFVHNVLIDQGNYGLDNPDPSNIIDSFEWLTSPEGHEFWASISPPQRIHRIDVFKHISSLYPIDQFPEYYI